MKGGKIDERSEEAMNPHRSISSISLMIEIKWKIHSIERKMFVFPFIFFLSSMEKRKERNLTSFPYSRRRQLKIVSNSFRSPNRFHFNIGM